MMIKLRLTITLILLFLLLFNIVNAQDNVLTGKIIAQIDGSPLAYASIRIPGMNISTVSNDDGDFELKITGNYTKDDSIVFSSIGYKSQSFSVNDALKSKTLVVKLSEAVQQLSEVAIKPLTVKQLLDSIVDHNRAAFISPMMLNGYYREFVFTNNKCNEYSDAIVKYYHNRAPKVGGQLKIVASRCEMVYKGKDTVSADNEIYLNSRANPDKLFRYAFLDELIKGRFVDKNLHDYTYSMEAGNDGGNLKVVVYPKPGTDELYTIAFLLSNDFTISSYKFEIREAELKNVKEKSFFNMHGRLVKLLVEARFESNKHGTYPDYFKFNSAHHIYTNGKFLGQVIDQISEQKSEFVITGLDTLNALPFSRSDIYKKGNICNNGMAMNTSLLKNYNFIKPTKKDSLAISSIQQEQPAAK